MTDLIPSLSIVDGTPHVSSLDIADRFGKSHDQVLKAVRKIIAECPAEFNAVNFDAVDYTDVKGESRPAYSLTRDAFSLVAMGFTGKAALVWKVRYIEAFTAMEKKILASRRPRRQQKSLPCMDLALEPRVYLKGKKLFEFMSKLMTDFDLVKTHVQLWAHPGSRMSRLSPEMEIIYQNAADASKMALCSLNQAQFALRIAMGIKADVSFDGR